MGTYIIAIDLACQLFKSLKTLFLIIYSQYFRPNLTVENDAIQIHYQNIMTSWICIINYFGESKCCLFHLARAKCTPTLAQFSSSPVPEGPKFFLLNNKIIENCYNRVLLLRRKDEPKRKRRRNKLQ